MPDSSDNPEAGSKESVPTSSVSRRFTAEVDVRWGDILLLVCFFVAGLVDSAAFNLYGCFVSMQTGNTIFVGLGKRWVLVASFLIQSVLTGLVALLATTGAVRNSPNDRTTTHKDGWIIERVRNDFPYSDYAPIILLAFQSAGQIVASRVLKYNSMPTVVLTSLYCDMMSDAKLFTAPITDNADRNRRATGALLLFAGAVSGGFLSKSWVGFAGALWIAAFLKLCISFSWALWKPKAVNK
ncbi:hypothetical protein NW754_005635 [Fusarium falciforme]|nr:hypothetical protein NW754_005635 [Fusarium falciforme]